MTGADLIVKTLIGYGVTGVFGYPGGAVMPLYDSLYKYRSKIRHIRGAHEQGAAHAADGYARASGRLGVCISTSGPGATNLVTGIATAFADSVPVLFITANVSTSEIGSDSFQEADITGITLPVCKYNWTVRDPRDLARVLNKAIKLAVSGRPGPTLVDVPKDILEYEFDRRYVPSCGGEDGGESEQRTPRVPSPGLEATERIAEAFNAAERPVVIAGGGIRLSGAENELSALVRRASCPLATTLMACGTIPRDDVLSAGMAGKYGSAYAKEVLRRADLVLAVGMRFSNRTHETVDGRATLIHIDSDAAEVDKNVKTSFSLVADAREALSLLLGLVEPRDNCWASEDPDLARIKAEELSSGGELREVFEACRDILGDDVYVVTDVGLHQMSVARHYPFGQPGRFITSGGFGTMGFGLGAACGAAVSLKEKKSCGEYVVLFTGDGSLRMNMSELTVLMEEKLKVLVVVVNNGSLGMVRKMQKEIYGGRFIATDSSPRIPDFKRVASAFGIKGVRASDPETVRKAISDFKESRGSMVVDYRIS